MATTRFLCRGLFVLLKFTNPRHEPRAVATEHVAEGVAVDYAADGRMTGIEILDARKRFGEVEVFRTVVLENVALGKPAA